MRFVYSPLLKILEVCLRRTNSGSLSFFTHPPEYLWTRHDLPICFLFPNPSFPFTPERREPLTSFSTTDRVNSRPFFPNSLGSCRPQFWHPCASFAGGSAPLDIYRRPVFCSWFLFLDPGWFRRFFPVSYTSRDEPGRARVKSYPVVCWPSFEL